MMAPVRTRRTDDVFFPALALMILGIVFTGFAPSYFLAGMVRAKLPSIWAHIHGALFVSWIFLLLVQTSLVAIRKVKWHIALGVLGLVLPPLMVVFGTLVVFDSIRNRDLGFPPQLLLVGDIGELILFAILITWGMLARRHPANHKRLMILGTMALLGPAIDRWHFGILVTIGVAFCLPLIVVVYDLVTVRRLYRSTAVGSALILGQILTLLPVSRLPIWNPCIEWIRHAR